MRNAIVVILTMLLPAAIVSAQSPVKFGVKAGVALANLSGGGWNDLTRTQGMPYDHSIRPGICLGTFLEFPLGHGDLSLQPEILYVRKGADGTVTTDNDILNMRIKNDYIEIPVLVKYPVFRRGSRVHSLFAGPVGAFNIGSKLEYDDVTTELGDALSSGNVENARGVDFGLTFGGGLAVGTDRRFTFDLRYTMGLTHVFDDVEPTTIDSTKQYMASDNGSAMPFKNNDIRLMAGYQF
jgi:hypothetical protein